MKNFITALQFLTTIRITRGEVCSTEEFARSMLYFPLVGLVIGGILWIVGYGTSLKLPAGLVAAVLVVGEIILTGGLHMDGYMDTMDGIFSGRSRERILEIMKDSRVGAHAAIALGGLLILKYAILTQIVSQKLWSVLVLAPVLGRFAMGIGAALFPYARPEGMGKDFSEFFTWRCLLITTVYSGLIAVAALYWRGAALWAAAGLWAWLFARFVTRRIGGLTGDVYGALNELTELVVLLVAVLIA